MATFSGRIDGNSERAGLELRQPIGYFVPGRFGAHEDAEAWSLALSLVEDH
ncbi:hypothetical protein [Aeromonas salmonicida]|uniref:Uncharacterized protein n=1 Tax=Aeromonas salmonicida subsp. salmonicida 01-B526 TaxID=1076135 RepID=A0ABN0DWY0_AERSS|nr:hypothetical protein IYQ_15623 [Aeromonas salmonicida subsp. salmonicida 01-B526]QOI93793.1 hypothetical protein G7042_00690 [Aeromonas salmonicida subsp. masoucida]QYH29383.1 hypothetical protein G9457_04610 [Aeromonas salmonicida subsp. masoucida]GAJ47517.1 hypothetical protein ASA01S_007_00510 [Aeromonas salmonicida subsp. masoucida NBRC 13784]